MDNNINTTASEVFSEWARTGKSDSMANQHAHSVNTMLTYLPETEFSFLDIGCGNGWVCRKIAALPNSVSVTGMDVATNMIQLARKRKTTEKEHYIAGEVPTVELPGNQDVIFAMESLYYMADLPECLSYLASLLKPGGRLIFGCDHHKQNPQTEEWSRQLGVHMHYLSNQEWQALFVDAGLTIQNSRHVQDPDSSEGWHRDEMGTLIIVAKK